MFFTDKDQATAILGDHISKLVKVAVFPEWHPFPGAARPPGTPGAALHVLRRRAGVGSYPGCFPLDPGYPGWPGFRRYRAAVSQLSRMYKTPRDRSRSRGVFLPGGLLCVRLTSIEKGGYYAIPAAHLPAVASLFAPALEGGRLLDPCAGEGRGTATSGRSVAVDALRQRTRHRPRGSVPDAVWSHAGRARRSLHLARVTRQFPRHLAAIRRTPGIWATRTTNAASSPCSSTAGNGCKRAAG